LQAESLFATVIVVANVQVSSGQRKLK
jgi:hypothetical protein